MPSLRASVTLSFAVELDDDDARADDQFDDVCAAITRRLEAESIPHVYEGSWSIETADTRPETVA